MIAYVNGAYLPHETASISIDDRALMFGDSVFDATRTFAGIPFRLDDHLERLRRSMRYVELDGDALIEEVRAASIGVIERNAEVIASEGDVWLNQIVSRGKVADPEDAAYRPTVIVKLRMLKFDIFGPLYERGVDLHTSLLVDHFAGAIDPRVKAANRLGAVRAELKGVRAHRRSGGGQWTVVFNSDGSLSETQSANLCVVSGRRLLHPPRHDALEGISLATLGELATDLGLEVEERRLTLFDVLNSDETLLTASSFSVLPVNSVDGISLTGKRAYYEALLERWIDIVGVDFVTQARDRAGASRASLVK